MRGGMRKLLVVDHVGRHTRPSEIELATTGSSRQTTNGGDEARKKRELILRGVWANDAALGRKVRRCPGAAAAPALLMRKTKQGRCASLFEVYHSVTTEISV